MSFNPNDLNGFPSPTTFRQIDFASLVDDIDATKQIPVAYAFGGNAPVMVSIGNGKPFEVSSTSGYGRIFVETDPYGWVVNP